MLRYQAFSTSLYHTGSESTGNPEALGRAVLGTFCTDTLSIGKEKQAKYLSQNPVLAPPWELYPKKNRGWALCSILAPEGLDPLRLNCKNSYFYCTVLFFLFNLPFLFCNYCQEMFAENLLDFWQSVMGREELFQALPEAAICLGERCRERSFCPPMRKN